MILFKNRNVFYYVIKYNYSEILRVEFLPGELEKYNFYSSWKLVYFSQ